MSGNVVRRAWARGLDIEVNAPRHGALLKGRELVGRFIDG